MLGCVLLLAAGGARGEAPTLLLFPRAPGDSADARALVAMRKALRADGHFQILTFDPESSAVKRAAADAHHPEWLTRTYAADPVRLEVARAVGAAFFVVLADGGRGRTAAHLAETLPAARVWDFPDQKLDDAARSLTAQALDSLKTPAPAAPQLPAAVTPPPVVAPPSVVPTPAPVSAPLPRRRTPSPVLEPRDDLAAVASTLAQGDRALESGDVVGAIASYRDAVNGAPRHVVPRLKLAGAYLQAGLREKALDEARRALDVAPNDAPVQEFLRRWDTETGSSDGAVMRGRGLVAKNPQDPGAHLTLGDALWNNNALVEAEAEYKAAQRLTPTGDAAGRLARLYAAQARYDDSLAALQTAGAGGYALALSIVQSRADTLSSTLTGARESFDAGKTTRESFYDALKGASAQSQELADFVAKIAPPLRYKLSHLHRKLATNLLAQQAAMLVNYVETSDAGLAEKAAALEKNAQMEMLTAYSAERKLGLWRAKEDVKE